MENIPRLKRSTHVYCPVCCINLSEYNMKSCEGCGLVFGDIEPVFGMPEPRTKPAKRDRVDEPVLRENKTCVNTWKTKYFPLKKSSTL